MWHVQRKTMSKIFFKKNFEGFLQKVFERHSRDLCAVLREHAASGAPVDAQQLMFAFTLDCIGEIGFGTNFDTLRNSNSSSSSGSNNRNNNSDTNNPDSPSSVGPAFDECQEGVFMRVLRPGFHLPVGAKFSGCRFVRACLCRA